VIIRQLFDVSSHIICKIITSNIPLMKLHYMHGVRDVEYCSSSFKVIEGQSRSYICKVILCVTADKYCKYTFDVFD